MLETPDDGRVWKRMLESTSPDANTGKKRLRLMRATGPQTAAWREHVIPQVLSVVKHRDRQLMNAFDHWKKLRADKFKDKASASVASVRFALATRVKIRTKQVK